MICIYLAEPSNSLVDLRTRALFWVILSSGARISEALSLARLSIRDLSAIVIQKGGSEHQMIVSEMAQIAVTDYLTARHDHSEAMFISHRPDRLDGVLSNKETQHEWSRLCLKLGIRRFTSHQIRHTCATEMLRQGVHPMVIAKHMGHRGLGSIEGYAEVGLEARRRAVEGFDGRPAA
jgi:site-specific recombinase XerD